MNRKFVQTVGLLLLFFGSVSANNLSDLIRKSPYCVVGEIITVDSITYSFKIDSSINSKLSFDTIQVFKNVNSLSYQTYNKIYVPGEKFILFLGNPYHFEAIEGYFELGNNDGEFQIVNDSVTYDKYKSTAFDFIKTVQSYYKQYNSFCSTFQDGEQTSKEIETFKKASVINQKLIEETYEHCYSNNTLMDNAIPVVSAIKMNVLYVGPENPVCIAVPKYASSDLCATIIDGEILKDGECYKVKVYKPGRTKICVLEKKTNKSLGCTEFRVKMIPDPVVYFLGMNGGVVSKRLLVAGKMIDSRLMNLDIDISYPIKFYTVTITNNGNTVSYKGIGNRLTPEILEAFKNVNIGSKIYFENVVVEAEIIGVRTLGTIMFKVEE